MNQTCVRSVSGLVIDMACYESGMCQLWLQLLNNDITKPCIVLHIYCTQKQANQETMEAMQYNTPCLIHS